jgi:hypothetical protein
VVSGRILLIFFAGNFQNIAARVGSIGVTCLFSFTILIFLPETQRIDQKRAGACIQKALLFNEQSMMANRTGRTRRGTA